jgi:sulfur carrier protein ThiS
VNITLKLYATLASCLPAEAVKNEVEITVDDGTTIRQVLDFYNVPFERCHLVLVNGVFSPPATARQVALKEGDALAVWPPVAGG